MPFVENQGCKTYWDDRGAGEPLLLIMGLSYPSYMWHRSRSVLSERYRTIALMASDAAAVLDAAGVESAHLFGVSMGGMIAQEFAFQYSKRVLSLILGCTASGGPHAVQAEPAHAKFSAPANQVSHFPQRDLDEAVRLRAAWFKPGSGKLRRERIRTRHLLGRPSRPSKHPATKAK